MITAMQSTSGESVHDRRGIADVFADFYASLYSQPDGTNSDLKPGRTMENQRVPAFSDEEMVNALR